MELAKAAGIEPVQLMDLRDFDLAFLWRCPKRVLSGQGAKSN
jgi:hypothetical protein